MTNFDKFKEVFGFEPNTKTTCIAIDCDCCPIADWGSNKMCGDCEKNIRKWWNSEYKGVKKNVD